MKLLNQLGRRTCTGLAALLAIGSTAHGQPTLHMRPPSQRLALAAQPAAPPPAPPAPQPPPSPDAPPATPDAPPAAPARDAVPPGAPAAPPAGAAPASDVPVAAEVAPPTEGEVIVVTGSRIGDPLGKQSPVLMLSREDLDRTGLTSIGDILQQLPVSGGAINGKFNSSGNFGFPPDGGGIGAGAVEADLRYLTSKRVLVLVDGVRWVNGSSASGVAAATDLNTIPLSVVERIEVLEDGASPIYGSDAIAGVINIITRKSLTGGLASVYTGGFQKGDGFIQKYDVAWGSSTDKTSIVVGATFHDQHSVYSRDRDISAFVTPDVGMCTNRCSSTTPQGRIKYLPPGVTDPKQAINITLNDGTSAPVVGSTYHDFTDADRFNFAEYNLVETPSRRTSAFSSLTYKLLPTVNLRAKASFTNRQSVNQAGPEPLFLGPDGGNGNRLDTMVIDATNPYNPFGFTLVSGQNLFAATRRPIEAGPRTFEQNVDTFYVSGGLDGHIDSGDQRFNWDATVAYGVNHADQRRNNAFNSLKLQQALGPAFRDADGVYRCGTDAQHIVDPRCVPFNFFGGMGPDGKGTITPQMLAFTTFTEHDVSEQQLVDAVGNVTGNLVKLPAGWLAAAVGVEHRRLSGYYEPDAVVAAGDGADVPSTPTAGQYSVSEAYAELRAPLVAGATAAELIDVNAAARISKYSFLDAELTGKVGARWKPTKDLIIRGSYARGFRAPSIGELFGNKARFDANLSDPCSDLNAPGVTPEIRARCIALGVPADGSYVQANSQISVATGGNRALAPEISDSYNLSAAYSPAALQNRPGIDSLDFELAYWDVRVAGAIAALDAQFQINQCVGPNPGTYCDGIVRNAQGTISSFSNALQNLNGINVRGLDLTVGYRAPRMNFGRLRAAWNSSYLLAYQELTPNGHGFDVHDLTGQIAGTPERAFPRLKSQLALGWQYDEFDTTLTTRYIHSMTESCVDFTGYPTTCSDFNKTDDTLSTNHLGVTVYNDIQVVWSPQFDHGLTVTAGVDNLFNVNPPACFSCSLNGFNGLTYDVPGIFGYVSAAYHVQ
jgi:iron complex outermembrane receptor protein